MPAVQRHAHACEKPRPFAESYTATGRAYGEHAVVVAFTVRCVCGWFLWVAE